MLPLMRVVPLVIAAFLVAALPAAAQTPKVWEVVAGKDATFKVVGEKKPVITVKTGEVVNIKVTGEKGSEVAKNGSVHSITIYALKDQGWNVPVKEGVNEFTFVAPAPGEYQIICIVKCGHGHIEMKMKLVVTA